MKSISLRGIPDKVYLALKDWARINHRSLQEQIKIMLEREVHLAEGSQIDRALAWRRRFSGRRLGNVVQDIHKERNR